MERSIDRLRAEFCSPETEQGFRVYVKAFTRPQLAFALILLTLPILVFARLDYILFGASPQLWRLFAARGFTILVFAVLVILAVRVRHSLRLDLPVLSALLIYSLLILYINSTRPPDHYNHSIIDILVLLAFYFIVPNRFIYQCWAALLLTACAFLNYLVFRDPAPALVSTVFWFSYIFANLLGIWFTRHLHLVHRHRYSLLLEQRETSRALEQALREVKTLEGILPICSNCKKIRSSDGYWKQVETYIESHSAARFTHSLCQDCMQDLYGIEYSPGEPAVNPPNQSSSGA